MKENIQSNRAFFNPCLPIAFTLNDVGQFFSQLAKFSKTLKFSSAKVECSFDNSVENILPKIRNFSAKIPKLTKNNFFREKFPPKCSSGHAECSFDNPAASFFLLFGKKVRLFEDGRFFFQKRFRWCLCCRKRIKWLYILKTSLPP